MSSYTIIYLANQTLSCPKEDDPLPKTTPSAFASRPTDDSHIWDDATWILTSAFIIFTMQTGFAMLEAGAISAKSEVSIMMKNSLDVITGGLIYWFIGYGFSYGNSKRTNSFIGVGNFLVDGPESELGMLFTTYTFQLSFATTATTIASGAMAGRMKLSSYIIFSLFNTIVYAIPCHWIWDESGFLYKLGALDFAGSGVVHLSGAASGLCGAMLLGPRIGRYRSKRQDKSTADVESKKASLSKSDEEETFQLGDPVSSIVGCYILWWGWIGFNCGSTFGISGQKWQIASKTSITTLLGSFSAGATGLFISWLRSGRRIFDVSAMVNSILGGLVSVTANSSMVEPWESCIIGMVGAIVTIWSAEMLEYFHIDDPEVTTMVSAVAVHGFAGIWGLLAVGIFAWNPTEQDMEWVTRGQNGLFHGGGFYLLGVQLLTAVTITSWSFVSSLMILWPIDKTLGLRLTVEHEVLGSDYVEHGLQQESAVEDRALLHVLLRPEKLHESNRVKMERYFTELVQTRLRDQTQLLKLNRLIELPLITGSITNYSLEGEMTKGGKPSSEHHTQ